MFFENKYDVASIKKLYDKADKNFNPSKSMNTTDTEPSPATFQTKIWYKLYSMVYKSAEKAKKGKNSEYYKQIDATNGDYSRRGQGVGEQVEVTYSYIKKLIKNDPKLQYSMCGVFCDTYENLKDLKWRAAYKLAYDTVSKNKNVKSLVGAFKLMYWTEVFACESMMLKLIELPFKAEEGLNAYDVVQNIQYRNKTFMDKVVIPGINLSAMIRGTKEPAKMVRNYIGGEKNAEKAQESMMDVHLTSEEGVFFNTLKKAAGNIVAVVTEGTAAVLALITTTTAASGVAASGSLAAFIAGTGPAGLAVGATISVALCIIFLFTLIPTIRLIIYYSYTSEIDMVKELELHRELLENNIMSLKERYDGMRPGPEKDKLRDVIKKQEKMYKDLVEKLEKRKEDDPYAAEDIMSADEQYSDEEAERNGIDTNTDGDSTNGYSIEI